MAELKKYNLEGDQVGEATVSDAIAKAVASSQSLKDYIVAVRANNRQWSANTKDRGEVACTTKKPHRQKGTGNARQGSTVSPQYRGGGVVFGPKPKFDQHIRINRKERKAAIRALLASKIQAGQCIVVDSFSMEEPKTKKLHTFLQKVGVAGKVLFLDQRVERKGGQSSGISLSVRNLPQAHYRPSMTVNAYDLLLFAHIVVSEAALKEIEEWLA